MTEWYEKPYKGSPPDYKIKGFPRPLYPPDAATYGKQPSTRGPDCEAYKRVVCKLGRWGDWDPSKWDDGYWTEFAHGKDLENTDDKRKWSGVAGFQYQMRIDATGWLGRATFDALCYALIPEAPGFPHGGEQAMDSVAVSMINEAWEMFQGEDTDVEIGQTIRLQALDRARSQLGYVEGADNANKYGDWYGMNYQPWCAMFCTWCFELASDGASPAFVRGSRYAYVPYIVGDARAGRYGLKTTDDPKPGDLVCYDWNWNGEHDHVGIYEENLGSGNFNAIEGNTSPANNSNGGQVMRRTRNKKGQGTVFVRVAEP